MIIHVSIQNFICLKFISFYDYLGFSQITNVKNMGSERFCLCCFSSAFVHQERESSMRMSTNPITHSKQEKKNSMTARESLTNSSFEKQRVIGILNEKARDSIVKSQSE
jgi:hypothetical protein